MRNKNIDLIAEFGVLFALFFVLDFFSRTFPQLTPIPGSVISLVPTLLIFVGLKYGPIKGAVFGLMAPFILFIYGAVFFINPIQYMFDYHLALAGIAFVSGMVFKIKGFKNQSALAFLAAILALTWQYTSYFIALSTYYAEGSLFAANAYMIPMVVTNIIFATLLVPRMWRATKRMEV